jgi:hypothetical protein
MALTGRKTVRHTKAPSVRKQEPGFRKNRGWMAPVCWKRHRHNLVRACNSEQAGCSPGTRVKAEARLRADYPRSGSFRVRPPKSIRAVPSNSDAGPSFRCAARFRWLAEQVHCARRRSASCREAKPLVLRPAPCPELRDVAPTVDAFAEPLNARSCQGARHSLESVLLPLLLQLVAWELNVIRIRPARPECESRCLDSATLPVAAYVRRSRECARHFVLVAKCFYSTPSAAVPRCRGRPLGFDPHRRRRCGSLSQA